MANRSFQDTQYTILKRRVELYAQILMSGTTPLLLKWNYPGLGTLSTVARTYSVAPTANTLPTGNPYPLEYFCGSEGVRSVTRTAQGLWTIKLQDNYQRVVGTSFTQTAVGVATTVATMGLNALGADMTASGGSTFGVIFTDYAGALVDPTDSLFLTFVLQDATEP